MDLGQPVAGNQEHPFAGAQEVVAQEEAHGSIELAPRRADAEVVRSRHAAGELDLVAGRLGVRAAQRRSQRGRSEFAAQRILVGQGEALTRAHRGLPLRPQPDDEAAARCQRDRSVVGGGEHAVLHDPGRVDLPVGEAPRLDRAQGDAFRLLARTAYVVAQAFAVAQPRAEQRRLAEVALVAPLEAQRTRGRRQPLRPDLAIAAQSRLVDELGEQRRGAVVAEIAAIAQRQILEVDRRLIPGRRGQQGLVGARQVEAAGPLALEAQVDLACDPK